jgi:hypothetical protein
MLATPAVSERNCLPGDALCEDGGGIPPRKPFVRGSAERRPTQKLPRTRLVGRDSVESEHSLSSPATV